MRFSSMMGSSITSEFVELIRIPTTAAWRLHSKEYVIIVKSKARHVNVGPNLNLAPQLLRTRRSVNQTDSYLC